MTMRRANRRWLDADCPAGVLAIFDNGGETFDRYTILYIPTGDGYVYGLAASADPFAPQGFGVTLCMVEHTVAPYRYRETSRHQSARWSDLPADVQRAVRRDLTD